jgi:membrane-associated phospholipid phosphatase
MVELCSLLEKTQYMQVKPRDLDKTQQEWSVKAARYLSHIFSPPMVYAILGFITAWAALPFIPGLLWGAIYGFFVSLLPLLLVIFLLKTGRIEDIHLNNSKERRIPYLVGIIGSIAAFIIISQFQGPALLGSLAIGSAIGLTVLALINNFWLISSHMASITMAAIFIWIVFGSLYGLIVVPLVVLVFAIRLYLRRHTVSQLLAGMLVGAGSIWLLRITDLL